MSTRTRARYHLAIATAYLTVAATPCMAPSGARVGEQRANQPAVAAALAAGDEPARRVATLRPKCVCGCRERAPSAGASAKLGPVLKLEVARPLERSPAPAPPAREARLPAAPAQPADPVPI